MANKIPSWSDVKDSGEDRMLYHKQNFDGLLESVETLTKDMLEAAKATEPAKESPRLRLLRVQSLRIVLDGMVKCFEQAYYDVFDTRFWLPKTSGNIKLSIAELVMIQEALKYSSEQVHDSLIPVFGMFGEDCDSYTEEEVETIMAITGNIEQEIQKVIDKDSGTIEIGG